MVDITALDDGCVDGRPTVGIVVRTEDGQKVLPIHVPNKERPKLAGGGYVTAFTMRAGVGIIGVDADTDLKETGLVLADKNIVSGAHIASSHSHDEQDLTTGCKANDEVDIAFDNASDTNKFEVKIIETTDSLLQAAGVELADGNLKLITNNWRKTLENENYFKNSTGKSRLDVVFATQEAVNEASDSEVQIAVTKELTGRHNEWYFVINLLEGKTFSQAKLLELLRVDFPDLDPNDLPQAFVVDVPRIVELARGAVDDQDVPSAIAAGVMFQASIAAVITDGTLPVFAYK
ncbi:MAG: hypothetical protein JWO54_674 [Candidatus Saccharibacteria bacterium]|nr:hypothetical protein [Candidatus Saccharibacteria bacterium]